MQTIVVSNVKDLEPSVKKWVQRLLGRALADEEAVTVTVFSPHATPAPSIRRVAGKRMDRILDKAARNMRRVSDRAYARALEEAMAHLRPRSR